MLHVLLWATVQLPFNCTACTADVPTCCADTAANGVHAIFVGALVVSCSSVLLLTGTRAILISDMSSSNFSGKPGYKGTNSV
jgi:hypothetical protein